MPGIVTDSSEKETGTRFETANFKADIDGEGFWALCGQPAGARGIRAGSGTDCENSGWQGRHPPGKYAENLGSLN